jgi:hypothetical protein
MEWMRRAYDAAGLTQFPTGRHLAAVQLLFGGSVILCLDVSGSMGIISPLMDGNTVLDHAINGSKRFVAEAIAAGYSVGGVLWNHGVAASTPSLSRSAEGAVRLFESAHPGGGNNIVPTLQLCEHQLEGQKGDLLIAVFGDGDLGDHGRAKSEADRLSQKNIRVITCGLGDSSAAQLGAISSEQTALRVAQHSDVSGAIAGMASALKRRT